MWDGGDLAGVTLVYENWMQFQGAQVGSQSIQFILQGDFEGFILKIAGGRLSIHFHEKHHEWKGTHIHEVKMYNIFLTEEVD